MSTEEHALRPGSAADYTGTLTDLHGQVIVLEVRGDMRVCLAYIDGAHDQVFTCRAQSLTPVATPEQVSRWCLHVDTHETIRAFLAGERVAL